MKGRHWSLLLGVLLLIGVLSLASCTAKDPNIEPWYQKAPLSVWDSDTASWITVDGELRLPAVYARWSVTTTNDEPTTMRLDGIAGQYFVIPSHSVVAFKLIIVARDDTADEMGVWKVENGSIKRAGDNTAVLVTATTDIVYRDDIGWSVAITGLPAQDALNLTVIGDDTNTTKWSAVLYGAVVQY